MPVRVYGKMIDQGGPRAMNKHIRGFIKQALRNALVRWREERLPLHFSRQAPQHYPGAYAPRARTTWLTKLHRWGHRRYLVQDPESLNSIVFQAKHFRYQPTGSSKLARLKIRVPRHGIKYKDEITATSPKEGKMVQRWVIDEVEKKLKALKDREVITI